MGLLKLCRKRRNQIFFFAGTTAFVALFQNCSGNGFAVNLDSGGTSLSSNLPTSDPTAVQPPGLPPPIPIGGLVTDLKIQSTSASSQSNLPFTFGQTFPPGALLKTETLEGKLADGSHLKLQVEAKATHADGSVRHAIISAVLPALAAGQTETLSLIKASGSTDTSPVITPQSILNSGFGASVSLNLAGVAYSASVNDYLNSKAFTNWLSGPQVNEWLVVMPLKTASGTAHPHLMARFDIRSYTGLNKVRVDAVIENGWIYEPNPQHFTYDVQINVGGQVVYSKNALKHFHHARWKKTFWWGAEPQIQLQHNTAYLILSRALPSYDQSVKIAEETLSGLQTNFSGAKTEPMGYGICEPAMPSTGGRPDIGLNPSWAVSYLLTQDARAKKATLGQADLAGSWSIHYRDKNKDLPLSVADYPYASLLGNPGDMINPKTNKSEAPAACTGDCTMTSEADVSHHPNLAYIPYLVTGDHYYFEELLFWSSYVTFNGNPYYRLFEKGLIRSEQLRGQGWALRTMGDAAYITPDNHPMKVLLNQIVNNNLDWYNENYTNSATANKLGVIVTGYSVSYENGRGIAPWMDDFFTQSIGHLAELGFTKAQPLLLWKAKFSINRMTDPGSCWVLGAVYDLLIRDSDQSPFYETMAQTYQATASPAVQATACGSSEMATALGEGFVAGEMTGYSTSSEGYPANMQPALAYSVGSGAPNGLKAWDVFSKRAKKATYSDGPQFAIIPRK